MLDFWDFYVFKKTEKNLFSKSFSNPAQAGLIRAV